MMRRHWSQRVYAALLAIWFAVVGLDVGALGTCPMHGIAARKSGAAGAAAEQVGHADHQAATAPGDASSHAAQAERPAAPGQHHSHQCTCPGSCCCATPVAVPAFQSHLVPVVAFAPVYHAPARDVAPRRADLILPFPTAPPQGLPA